MKKSFGILLLLLFSAVVVAQKDFTFLPKWKVGDKKLVTIVQETREYKSGEGEPEVETTTLPVEVTVLSESDDAYVLKIVYENIAMQSAMKFYDKIGQDIPKYRDLTLKYKVSKTTGKTQLMNWRELQTFMKETIGEIVKTIKKVSPEAAPMIEGIFDPIMDLFKDKKTMDGYFSGEVGFIVFPYDKKFVPGDTITTNSSTANPFSPNDSIN